MRIYAIFILFYFVTSSVNIYSQISVPGLPESYKIKAKSSVLIPARILELIDTNRLIQEDHEKKISNRYSVLQHINDNIKETGIKTIVKEGYIWRYCIRSPLTFSLGFKFSKYHLPPGAKVFLYSDDQAQLKGAFTEINNNSTNQLAISEIKGNNAIIEYFEPFNVDFSGELTIGSISQSYVNILSIINWRIDINCPEGQDWQTEKHAVCLMQFDDGLNGYYCTGSLINNVRSDGTPYFLTAFHCINSDIEAQSLVLYFNYEKDTCNSNTDIEYQTLSGSSLISGNQNSDFSLLLLNDIPPDSYIPCYAGWDASNKIPASGVCIHHPKGTEKRIAIDTNPLKSNSTIISWNDLNDNSPVNSHWMVNFKSGDVEEGSSGSPLFDENKRIVGQLHGTMVLGDTSSFGKFNLSWNGGLKKNQKLAPWLDPDSTGTKEVNSIFRNLKPLPEFKASKLISCTNSNVVFTDLSQQHPIHWKWSISPSTFGFINSTDSNSQNPEVIFLKSGLYSVSLTVSNLEGENTKVKNNYIEVKDTMKLELSGFRADTSLCANELGIHPIVASGLLEYTFSILDSDKLNSSVNDDSLFLSVKSGQLILGSFKTLIKVVGRNGNCLSEDSIYLKIIAPVNDNVSNAYLLFPGSNGPFINDCASVENNEPDPGKLNCTSYDTWCLYPANEPIENTIWFYFKGPSNGMVTIDVPNNENRICVYDANSYSDLISGNTSYYSVLASSDSRIKSSGTYPLKNLKVTPGKTYWIQLDGINGKTGNYIINIFDYNLEIFPNPNNGKFDAIVSYPVESKADIKIYSILGSVVHTRQVSIVNDSYKFNFNLPNLNPGVYYINVSIGKILLRKKILIIK